MATVRLASTDGYDPHLAKLSEEQLTDARDAAAAGLKLLDTRAGERVTVPQVASMLRAFAELLGCPVPGQLGVDLFVAAIQEELPQRLLDTATIKVAKSHRFSRMPLPADVLTAVAGELAFIASQKAWLTMMFNTAMKALTLREKDRQRFPD